MKVAFIGSRGLTIVHPEDYLPLETSEIVSGGAKGVDQCAKNLAFSKGIPYKEFLPEYDKYGKFAPLKRNLQIIDYSDLILAFWDEKSKGTKFVIDNCKKLNKAIKIIYPNS